VAVLVPSKQPIKMFRGLRRPAVDRESDRVTTDHQVLDLSVGELREEIVSTPHGLGWLEHADHESALRLRRAGLGA